MPNPDAEITLGRLKKPITRTDEIVSFMASNLETTRGFHQFMRSLPKIQNARPNARLLVIGGDDVSYGGKSKHSGGLRARMEAEVGYDVDWERVHF